MTGGEAAGAKEARDALRAWCRRLHGTPPVTPADELEAVAAWCRERELLWDHYGEGEVLQSLEADVAARTGKPAALFFPTGKMAQQVALRIHAAEFGDARVGIPPHSHLALHEANAIAVLSGLAPVTLGTAHEPTLPAHLEAIGEPLAAILVELPAREVGGQLPPWEALEELVALAEVVVEDAAACLADVAHRARARG